MYVAYLVWSKVLESFYHWATGYVPDTACYAVAGVGTVKTGPITATAKGRLWCTLNDKNDDDDIDISNHNTRLAFLQHDRQDKISYYRSTRRIVARNVKSKLCSPKPLIRKFLKDFSSSPHQVWGRWPKSRQLMMSTQPLRQTGVNLSFRYYWQQLQTHNNNRFPRKPKSPHW